MPAKISDAIKTVVPELPEEQLQKLVLAFSGSVHRGPLPPPEQLEEYNAIIPDGADRIMRMAEKQSAHRIEMETLVISSQQAQSRRGQLFGFAIGIFGILAGGSLAYAGHDWVGGGIAGSTVIALVYAFISGKREQSRDLSEKQPPRNQGE